MEDSTFHFSFMSSSLPTLSSKDFKLYFEKWYLQNNLKAWKFSFDKHFQQCLKDQFLKDFFKDPQVLSNIKLLENIGSQEKLDVPLSFKVKEISATATSMSFFDKLTEEGIIRQNGNICKCFDDFFEGIAISDELRKMILLEDSENFECFDDDERNELLFKLFSHIVIGGSICQYEDTIQPYFEVTKSLYKDLVSVQKKQGSNELTVLSKVYQVTCQDQNGRTFYPSAEDHPQTFAYIVIDPLKRHAILLYHCWNKELW